MKRGLTAFFTLIAAIIACTGTPGAMQIVDPPIYVCPTPPPVVPTPYPTIPSPPGYPTLVPLPTALPPPTATPYIIRPPQDFYVGDAILAGATGSSIRARFRLLNVRVLSASPRSVALWELEVTNVGSVPYELFPAMLMFVATVTTASGEVEGVWGASRAAYTAAGLPMTYEVASLAPGETRTFTLAAFIPAGIPKRLVYLLDPTRRISGTPYPGTNPLTWINQPNPVCHTES
jgi:hypothetical protein